METGMKREVLLLSGVIILLLSSLFFLYNWRKADTSAANEFLYIRQLQWLTGVSDLGIQHIHADFMLFVDGSEVDLNTEEFQAPDFWTEEFIKSNKANRFTHLHPGEDNRNLIHVHTTGVTLGMFFRTIGAALNESCLQLPEILGNKAYCTSEDEKLHIIVNGKEIANPDSYVIQDLDKILIAYGEYTQEDIDSYLTSMGNRACVQSKKC